MDAASELQRVRRAVSTGLRWESVGAAEAPGSQAGQPQARSLHFRLRFAQRSSRSVSSSLLVCRTRAQALSAAHAGVYAETYSFSCARLEADVQPQRLCHGE